MLSIWIRYYASLLAIPLRALALRRRFPTCEFYGGAFVDERSRLGRYNVVFGNAKIVNSTLGSHTFVQQNSIVVNATIGKFCSIAADVRIGLGEHPVDRVSSHPAFYATTQPIARTFATADTFDPFKPVTIGHDVWIGQGALIAGGVTIGNGAVVAANSVVTKNVRRYAMVGGVPATTIRSRFAPDLLAKIDALEWWNRPEAWLAKYCPLFADPELLLEALSGDQSVGLQEGCQE